MPVELRMELVATIGPDLLDTKRKLGNDVINKGNRVLLCMTSVDLQRAYACRIIDRGVLIPFDFLA